MMKLHLNYVLPVTPAKEVIIGIDKFHFKNTLNNHPVCTTLITLPSAEAKLQINIQQFSYQNSEDDI